MKVEVQMNDGRVKSLTRAQARAIVFIGKGQYLTRDMVAAPASPVQSAVAVPVAPAVPADPELETSADDAPRKRGRPRKVKDTE